MRLSDFISGSLYAFNQLFPFEIGAVRLHVAGDGIRINFRGANHRERLFPISL